MLRWVVTCVAAAALTGCAATEAGGRATPAAIDAPGPVSAATAEAPSPGASAAEPQPPLGDAVLESLRSPQWAEDAPRFGDRGVPVLARLLGDARPHVVHRAAATLVRIDTDAARAAVLASLAARISSFVEQADRGFLEAGPSRATLRAGLATLPPGDLRHAVARAAFWDGGNPEDWVWQALDADPPLLRRLLDDGALGLLGRWGHLLRYGLRSRDEETRRAAWRRLDELAAMTDDAWASEAYVHHTAGAMLGDCTALLADERFVRAVARVLRRRVSVWPPIRATLLVNPVTRRAAVAGALDGSWDDPPAAEVLAAALAEGLASVHPATRDFGANLARVAGPVLTPDLARRIAAEWPPDAAADARAFFAALAAQSPQRADTAWASFDALPAPALVAAVFAETGRPDPAKPPAAATELVRTGRDPEVVARLSALVASAGPDREAAANALRAIRDAQRLTDEARLVAESLALRSRAAVLLASKVARERRAGIAAAAASPWPGAATELLRLALEDPDPDVADDARRALVAMGRPAAAPPGDAAPAGR